jgi:hypothetical protein
MLWTYQRSNQTLQIEMRIDSSRKEYVLIVRADGAEQVVCDADAVSFQMRVVALERQLEREDWQTTSAVAMRDAWKL